jgi:hypothetical protein
MSILLASASIISCAKDGETGPQGPAGVDGKNGNANVIGKTSTIVSFNYSSTQNTYNAIINCPEITQNILETGMVLVYEKVANNQWMAWNANVGTTYYIYNFRLGEVTLEYRNTAGITTNEGNKEMRVVIVPSSSVNKLPQDLSDLSSVIYSIGQF